MINGELVRKSYSREKKAPYLNLDNMLVRAPKLALLAFITKFIFDVN